MPRFITEILVIHGKAENVSYWNTYVGRLLSTNKLENTLKANLHENDSAK
jgi:hypothetical protein